MPVIADIDVGKLITKMKIRPDLLKAVHKATQSIIREQMKEYVASLELSLALNSFEVATVQLKLIEIQFNDTKKAVYDASHNQKMKRRIYLKNAGADPDSPVPPVIMKNMKRNKRVSMAIANIENKHRAMVQ